MKQVRLVSLMMALMGINLTVIPLCATNDAQDAKSSKTATYVKKGLALASVGILAKNMPALIEGATDIMSILLKATVREKPDEKVVAALFTCGIGVISLVNIAAPTKAMWDAGKYILGYQSKEQQNNTEQKKSSVLSTVGTYSKKTIAALTLAVAGCSAGVLSMLALQADISSPSEALAFSSHVAALGYLSAQLGKYIIS